MKKTKRSDLALVALFCAWIAFAAGWVIFHKDKDYSANEKRYLAQTPALQLDSVLDGSFGSAVEDWMSDQFPGRDMWVGINAYIQLASGLNGESGVYLGSDGYLVKAPVSENKRVTDMAARKIAAFAETVGVPVRMTLVPSAGYMLPEKLPQAHYAYHDGEIVSSVREAVGAGVQWIDAETALRADGEMYYRTDHHWTSLGAYTFYRAYCESAGLAPVEADAFEIESVAGFYGTNWSSAALWGVKPDNIELWTNPDLRVTVTIPETDAVSQSVFFRARLEETDKYPVFLDGNHPLTVIENPDVAGVLLLVKDSYAHCLAPFLAAHYGKIVMVDMRYYHLPLSDLCRSEGVTDVLVLYSVGTFVEAQDLAFLK